MVTHVLLLFALQVLGVSFHQLNLGNELVVRLLKVEVTICELWLSYLGLELPL